MGLTSRYYHKAGGYLLFALLFDVFIAMVTGAQCIAGVLTCIGIFGKVLSLGGEHHGKHCPCELWVVHAF